MQVQVLSGDRTHYLGLGTLIGYANVYAVVTEDGAILSEHDAEQPHDDCIILQGNPKIKLDSGEIVYGCQVWWSEVKECT